MCGIAGFTGTHDPVILSRMTESLIHRGPDSAGYWQGPGVSLGMRRLAIIISQPQPLIRAEVYFAVTSNTVQFGAKVELIGWGWQERASSLQGSFEVLACLEADAMRGGAVLRLLDGRPAGPGPATA